jgi:type I restriction enzyme M protein
VPRGSDPSTIGRANDGPIRQALTAAFVAWWSAHQERLAKLPETQALMALRAELLASFEKALVPVGLLDRFRVAGAIAAWWGEVVFDFRTLMARGFEGVVEGWVTTIVAALEDGGSKTDPLDHQLVKKLLPEFLDEIAEVERQVAELDGATRPRPRTTTRTRTEATTRRPCPRLRSRRSRRSCQRPGRS